MNLAMSAIAWEPSADDAAARILRENGFAGVELAPTKIFPRPDSATDAEVAACGQDQDAHEKPTDDGHRVMGSAQVCSSRSTAARQNRFSRVARRDSGAQRLDAPRDSVARLSRSRDGRF